MLANFYPFLLVLFANLWIWRLLSQNIFIGLLMLSSSIFLYLSLKPNSKKTVSILFFTLFILVLFSQYKTTRLTPLTSLGNDQKRIQDMRLNAYPPVFIKLGGEKLWIPLAHWFEGRRETIAAFRIQKNFSEAIDPMLYFFANHPRERVGLEEFEKFPYILLPFFIFGISTLSKKSRNKNLALSLLAPIVLVSLIGNKNPLGPFSLFPFLSIVTATGIKKAYKKIALMPKNKFKPALIALFTVLILVFLQIIAYAKY